MARHIDIAPRRLRCPTTGLHRSRRSRRPSVSARPPRSISRSPVLSRRCIEAQGRRDRAPSPARHGAETIVGVDPDHASACSSRRPITAPTSRSARPSRSGVHMNCGGGVGGFIASRDEERYVRQYNGFLISITGTARSPASTASASPARIRPPTACARRARTGPATRSISGRSPTRSTCRCWGRRVSARSARLILAAGPLRGAALVADHRRADAVSQQGFFKEFVVDFDGTGRDGRRHQQGAAQRAHLRRQGPLAGVARTRPERALLRDRDPYARSDIDRLAGGAAGGDGR